MLEVVDVVKGGFQVAPAYDLAGQLAEGGKDTVAAGGAGVEAGFEVQEVVECQSVGTLQRFEGEADVWPSEKPVGEGVAAGDLLGQGAVDDVGAGGCAEQQAEFDVASVGGDEDEGMCGKGIKCLPNALDFSTAGFGAEEAGDEEGADGKGNVFSGVGFEVEGDVEHELEEDDQAEGPAAAQGGGPEQAVGAALYVGGSDAVGCVFDVQVGQRRAGASGAGQVGDDGGQAESDGGRIPAGFFAEGLKAGFERPGKILGDASWIDESHGGI